MQHVSASDDPQDPSMTLDRCVEHDKLSSDMDWTFVAITFKNATELEQSSAKVVNVFFWWVDGYGTVST